ncbi:MAG: MBL fold metallo-hydrolase, partial [bacterium]
MNIAPWMALRAGRVATTRMAPSAPRALATRLAQTVVRVAAPWMAPSATRARAAWITAPWVTGASIAGLAAALLHFRERSSPSGLLRAPARLHRRRARVFRRVGPALIFLLLPVTLFADLVVHTIDVGQGDATFLRHEEHTILVDAGPDNARARRYLQSINIDNIDIAIATHAHADHIGGFPDLFEHANIDELWYNGQAHTTWTFEQFLDAVESSDTGYEEPVRGDVISHGPLEIEVLHPTQTAAEYDGPLHDYTLVVRVTYEDTSILFPGDAEHALESQLLAATAPVQSPAAPAPAPSDAARNDDLSNDNDTAHVPDRDEGQNITLSSDVLR